MGLPWWPVWARRRPSRVLLACIAWCDSQKQLFKVPAHLQHLIQAFVSGLFVQVAWALPGLPCTPEQPYRTCPAPSLPHPRLQPFGRQGRARMGHGLSATQVHLKQKKLKFVLDVWGWILLANGKSGSKVLILCFYCFENGQIWKIIKSIRGKMNITHLCHGE